MSYKLSELPTELKLYILRFLDIQAIRQCVSLINKEFNQLSKDYTLYEEYKATKFDVNGYKLRDQLNNELYRSYLKRLSISSDCVRSIFLQQHTFDLEKYKKLQELTVSTDSKISWMPVKIPKSIKSIHVHGRLSTANIAHLENLIPLLKKVDIVYIKEAADLGKKLEVPADLHLMVAEFFSSDGFLKNFLKGDICNLKKPTKIGIEIDHSTSLTARSNVLNHLARNVVDIEIAVDCSDAVDRDAIRVICRDCTSLKFLSLLLNKIKDSEEVREVQCTQLQKLALNNIRRDSSVDSEILLRFCLLMEATQHEIHLIGFCVNLFALLPWFSDSLKSFDVSDCTLSDQITGEEDRATFTMLSLRWVHMSNETLSRLLNPNITDLVLEINLQEIAIYSLLSSLTVLEEVSITGTTRDSVGLHQLLEALLPAKNTLRVFKSWKSVPYEDRRNILGVLQKFHRMQYVQLADVQGFRREIMEFFPSAIAYIWNQGVQIFI